MQNPLSYIELSKKALVHNFKALKSLIPNKKIACVVKANAYGHGQNEVVKILEPHADYFQIDDIEELRLLRGIHPSIASTGSPQANSGSFLKNSKMKKPVLVFGYVQKSDLEELVRLRGIPTIYDVERLVLLQKIGKKRKIKIPIHIKIDAYLGRQGLLLASIPQFISQLKKMPNVRVGGIYSHFANIEDTANTVHAKKQVADFMYAIQLFARAGIQDAHIHLSATSGVLALDAELPTSLARLGIGLYGMWPSDELKKSKKEKIELIPVMRWVSHVAQVKEIPKGFSVGYGCTYVAKCPTKIAIISQGYSDGFDRGLSNCGEVLIRGVRAPIIGRVAMNIIVADVMHIKNVRAEDEVVLLGNQKGERITAEEIAKKLNTINYEITTRTSSLLPRIVK